MGLDREFVILVAAGILSLAIVALTGLEHIVVGAALVAVVVALALVLALARFGPDRVPLEVYVRRRIAWSRNARRYSYVPSTSPPPVEVSRSAPVAPSPRPAFRPITWTTDAGAAYGAATALALIASGYFLIWIQAGGATELAEVWRMLLGR